MTRTKPAPHHHDHSDAHAAAAAAAAAETAVAPPSFIVYPIPSIADESFLQLIFRNKVKRSLFFGFGRSRMAIAELTSAEAAQEVEGILRESASATRAAAAPGHDAAQHRRGTTAEREVAEEKEEDGDNQQAAMTNIDEMTLADMFAAPATADGNDKDKDNHTHKETNYPTAAAALNDHSIGNFRHLPFLVFRGRPVHVVVSGVRVDDFYASGGTVPEKRENKESRSSSSSKKKFKKDSAAAAAGAGAAPGEKRGRDAEKAGTPRMSGGETAVAASTAATPKFPKNTCQKCGSPHHFTRHCDGSGVAGSADTPGAAAEAALETVTGEHKAPSLTSSAAHTAAVAPREKFPKGCCQKCGSPGHFTRHCDRSGPTSATTTSATATDLSPAEKARAEEAEPPRQQREEVTVTVKTKPPTLVQRTSNDQCKYCGSDAHLSRHCPNK